MPSLQSLLIFLALSAGVFGIPSPRSKKADEKWKSDRAKDAKMRSDLDNAFANIAKFVASTKINNTGLKPDSRINFPGSNTSALIKVIPEILTNETHTVAFTNPQHFDDQHHDFKVYSGAYARMIALEKFNEHIWVKKNIIFKQEIDEDQLSKELVKAVKKLPRKYVKSAICA